MRAILDGLHDSLNRVDSKPHYIDIYKEFETSSTKDELAQIAWDYHKSLNDSIIQDIFCGE
jgi:ubiquitin C-terminal hydrolase